MAAQVTFTYNPGVEDELKSMPEILDQIESLGEEIASQIPGMSPMGGSEPGRYGTPQVQRDEDGVTVFTDGPFAHIAEFGGAYSGPDAAFRRAAASVGKFEEH